MMFKNDYQKVRSEYNLHQCFPNLGPIFGHGPVSLSRQQAQQNA